MINQEFKEKGCCSKTENEISEKKILYCGIDFGTTHCLISYFEILENFKEPELKFIKNRKTSCNFFPSIVSIDQNNKYFFCSEFAECSSNLKITKSIKRIIGLSLSEVKKILHELSFEIDFEKSRENNIFIFIGGANQKSRSLKDIVLGMMSALFSEIKENEESNKFEVFKAVITVPAYFDENSRIIIKEAAILAGFEVLKLINEPTAAALAYMNSFINCGENSNYLVYDLGGGTFDISILKSHNNEFFRVIGIGGDKYLGGDDFDIALADFLCNQNEMNLFKLPLDIKNKLIFEAKKFKENFNSGLLPKEAIFGFSFDGSKRIEARIDNEIFSKVFSQIIEKTIQIMEKTLKEIDLTFEDLEGIILVGGSSRMNLIKNRIKKILDDKALNNKVKIFDSINPDEVVSIGAALYALNLNPVLENFDESEEDDSFLNSWKKKFKQYFIDAISQNLGIEVGDGLCETLIPRNSPIPISSKQIFSTQIDSQKSVRISICQGQSKIFKENSFLGEFVLDDLPESRAGELKIEISFNIDCDGILAVFAKILNFDSLGDESYKSHYLKIK